jgi:hypothetical protein
MRLRAVLLALVAGCGASSGYEAALRRGSSDFHCPRSTLYVQSLGAGGYRVRGCGHEAVYTCTQTSGALGRVATTCTTDAAPASAGGESLGATWTDVHVDALVSRIRNDVLACMPATSFVLAVPVVLGADGRIERDSRVRTSLPIDVGSCIDELLRRQSMQGRVDRELRTELRFEREGARTVSRTSSAPPVPPATAARGAIDGRAPALLACVAEGAALGLEIRWAADGRLDAALRGDAHGTPEEECVRAIVQQLAIAAPGSEGSIVHALQR